MGVSSGIPASQAWDAHQKVDKYRCYLENTFLTSQSMSRAAVLGPHSPEAAESEHLGMNGTQESAFKLADKVGCEHNFENRCASYLVY